MRNVAIRISGKVQGVFFRASAQQEAERLGIKGYTRNEPDGSVYIEAEGQDERLQQFIAWCWKGPTRARVDQVTVSEGNVKGYVEFSVQR